MSKPRKKSGPCYRCGAELSMANCPPGVTRDATYCEDCGQCNCLRRYVQDYKPETDWSRS